MRSIVAKLVIKTKGLPSETLELKQGVHRIGRSPQNEFVIKHDTLSRFHCEVEVKEDSMWVRDLDSSNGTFVDDVPAKELTELRKGQKLRLGEVVLEVVEACSAPAKS